VKRSGGTEGGGGIEREALAQLGGGGGESAAGGECESRDRHGGSAGQRGACPRPWRARPPLGAAPPDGARHPGPASPHLLMLPGSRCAPHRAHHPVMPLPACGRSPRGCRSRAPAAAGRGGGACMCRCGWSKGAPLPPARGAGRAVGQRRRSGEPQPTHAAAFHCCGRHANFHRPGGFCMWVSFPMGS
jgi:hypothetical protein